MANPAWGTKRTCLSCACKFYDFDRTPVACPRCHAAFDPAAGNRLRSDPSYKPSGGRAKSVFGAQAPLREPDAEPEPLLEEEEEDEEDADGAGEDEGTLEAVDELVVDDDLVEIPEADIER